MWNEDAILTEVALEQALNLLNPRQRLVVVLLAGLEQPSDWPFGNAEWPPTYAAVGAYVGTKMRGKPLSEGAVRYINRMARKQIRAKLGID